MIPTNIPEMATMLYMMEVNEWGAENLNDKLANDLAEASFDAAEVFFEVKGTRAADRLQAVKDKVPVKRLRRVNKVEEKTMLSESRLSCKLPKMVLTSD